MSQTIDFYSLINLTNLHAGSGDALYGVVDKEVQRDAVTRYPIIHASSIKGALREYFAHRFRESGGHDNNNVQEIFGKYIRKQSDTAQQGSHVFFEAKLLALPVRSNRKPCYWATSPGILTTFLQELSHFGVHDLLDANTVEEALAALTVPADKAASNLSDAEIAGVAALTTYQPTKPELLTNEGVSGLWIDEYSDFALLNNQPIKRLLAAMTAKNIIPTDLLIFPEHYMKEAADRLPVIARNNLENGISVNLWYEEVMPRRSYFYTFLLRPDNADDLFYNTLPEQKIVQIGANATVGYGQCKLERL